MCFTLCLHVEHVIFRLSIWKILLWVDLSIGICLYACVGMLKADSLVTQVSKLVFTRVAHTGDMWHMHSHTTEDNQLC
jgi:hypothetical protein